MKEKVPMTTNLKTGFIGTGAITEAMIVGLLNAGSLDPANLSISRRSEQRSTRLQQQFPDIRELDSNQQIADDSQWVFVAVLPEQTKAVLQEIDFDPQTTVVSLVGGVFVDQIRSYTGCQNVMRIVPLPPVEFGVGPIPIFPPNEPVQTLLNTVGSSVPLQQEKDLLVCASASALMATYFEEVKQIANWLHQQGLEAASSASYASNMLHALASTTIDKDLEQLREMSDECLTVGGLNEQVLFQKRQDQWFKSIDRNLDAILQRIS